MAQARWQLANRTFTLQHEQRDCGIACLRAVLRYHGGDESIETLRAWAGTDRQGTSLLGLQAAAVRAGCTAEGYEADLAALQTLEHPAILHTELRGGEPHFVVYYGADGRGVVVGDPASGLTRWSPQELEARWTSRACLVLEPGPAFAPATGKRRQQQRVLRQLLRPDASLLLLSSLLGLVVAGLGLVMAVYSQRLIDHILPTGNGRYVAGATALLILLLLVRVGLQAMRQLLLLRQGREFGGRINAFFFSRILHLPKAFYDSRKLGDLITRLHDVRRVQNTITLLGGTLLVDVCACLTSLGLVWYYNHRIGGVTLLLLPPYVWLLWAQNRRLMRAQNAVMGAHAASESHYISSLRGIADIQGFNKEPEFARANDAFCGHYQQQQYAFGREQLRLTAFSGLASVGMIAVILAMAIWAVLYQHLTYGELTAVLGAASGVLSSATGVALITVPINEARVAFERVHELGTTAPAAAPAAPQPLVLEHLRVQALSFRFPGRPQQLRDVSFEVGRGEIIAVAGESGSGKSLLCQLLQRLYQPESGAILVNGTTPYETIDVRTWRGGVQVVPQQVHLFNGTVLENIGLGATPERMAELCALLAQYGFMPYFNRLPQGLLTLVGEEGVQLSGGQRQLVGLARALCAEPQVLLLDEATAALDREAEAFVLGLLARLRPRMATVFITHRLHTLRSLASRIYLLEQGRVAHWGSHAELLRTDNLYRRYWADHEQAPAPELVPTSRATRRTPVAAFG